MTQTPNTPNTHNGDGAQPRGGQAAAPQTRAPDKINEPAKVSEDAARATRGIAEDAAAKARETARAGEKAVQTAAVIGEDAVQAARETADAVRRPAYETLDKAVEQSATQTQHLTDQWSRSVKSFSEGTSILANGAKDVSQEWLTLAQGQMRANIEAVTRLAGCRTAPDLLAVHSDLLRENLERTTEGGKAITQASMKALDAARRVMQPAI